MNEAKTESCLSVTITFMVDVRGIMPAASVASVPFLVAAVWTVQDPFNGNI